MGKKFKVQDQVGNPLMQVDVGGNLSARGTITGAHGIFLSDPTLDNVTDVPVLPTVRDNHIVYHEWSDHVYSQTPYNILTFEDNTLPVDFTYGVDNYDGEYMIDTPVIVNKPNIESNTTKALALTLTADQPYGEMTWTFEWTNGPALLHIYGLIEQSSTYDNCSLDVILNKYIDNSERRNYIGNVYNKNTWKTISYPIVNGTYTITIESYNYSSMYNNDPAPITSYISAVAVGLATTYKLPINKGDIVRYYNKWTPQPEDAYRLYIANHDIDDVNAMPYNNQDYTSLNPIIQTSQGGYKSFNDYTARPGYNSLSLTNLYTDETSMGATGIYAIATGQHTTASGDGSVASGKYTAAKGYYSHAEGVESMAHADGSHAEGVKTLATYGNVIKINDMTTDGLKLIVSSIPSNLTPPKTIRIFRDDSTTDESYIIYSTKVTSIVNVTSNSEYPRYELTLSNAIPYAEYFPGYISVYDSNGGWNGTHAEGESSIASGTAAHAEGSYTIASGDYSHAEGFGSSAPSNSAHAEGQYTIASGHYSHAEGDYTKANGRTSHAAGVYTIANGYAQTVIGMYNIPNGDPAIWSTTSVPKTDYAFIIGNGTSAGTNGVSRSNALAIDWNGKIFSSGSSINIKQPKTPTSSTDAGTKGDICWDANYIYVCVETNTWKRTALSTW